DDCFVWVDRWEVGAAGSVRHQDREARIDRIAVWLVAQDVDVVVSRAPYLSPRVSRPVGRHLGITRGWPGRVVQSGEFDPVVPDAPALDPDRPVGGVPAVACMRSIAGARGLVRPRIADPIG